MVHKQTALRRQRPRRAASDSHKSEYLHCISGPVNHPATNSGYPDGDAQPSVTLDYRRTYVIKPVSGTIRFAICPSAQGCFNLMAGKMTSGGIAADNTSVTGFINSAIANTVTDAFGQVPETFLASPFSSVGAPFITNGTPAFRPLVCVADVQYTGSSMMDNGSVTVTKMRNTEAINGSATVDAATDYQVDLAAFTSIPASALLPSSQVRAAREGFSVRSIPVRPLYETTTESITNASYTDNRYFKFRNALTTGNNLTPSYHPQCPWYVVSYEGLDDSASITVTYRYCIQYAVTGDNILGAIARPSPVESPGLLARAAAYVANLPVTARIGESLLSLGYNTMTSMINRALPALTNRALLALPHH